MNLRLAAPVIGASVTGTSHARAGLPCQDAFAVATDGDVFAIAVADGLGSAARSDLGARTAVDAAVATIDEPVKMAERARAALEQLDVPTLRDVACTLLIAVSKPDGTVSIAHIGDGGIAGLGADDEVLLLSGPDRTEYVNEVTPLTSDNWIDPMRFSEAVVDVRALALFTDGCERAALVPGGTPHPGFFLPLFAFARGVEDGDGAREQLESLLGGPKMSEHSDDDKTLVIAWLPPRS